MFSLAPQLVALATFVLVYLYLIFSKRFKSGAVWIGVLFLVLFGILSPGQILGFINWNVLGIFAGTLIVAELFIYSRIPEVTAHFLVGRSRTVGSAILWVCLLSGLLSAFMENVATVLIIAPVALELARRLKTSAKPFLIGLAISSNLQGTATLIGDPPSMILAGFERMNFNDFFFYKGRPGIFFAVQLGALTSFLVLYVSFRRYRQPVAPIPPEHIRTWVPLGLLTGMVAALALASIWDPEFSYLGGVICMMAAVAGLIWHATNDSHSAWAILKRYDWDTTFFLAGIFVLVGALEQVGLIERLKELIKEVMGPSVFANYTFVVWFSVLVSAFIDNVPYITTMIPVVHRLGATLGAPPELMVFGLLIGACLGGNITPLGASANIVAAGVLKRQGTPASFMEFVRIGLPFTLAATLAGYIFIGLIWS